MSSMQFDESRWPVVVCTFPLNVNEDDIRVYNSKLLEYTSRKVRFSIINDFTHTNMTIKLQQLSQDCIEKNRDVFRKYIAGIACLIANPALRTMLRAFALVARTPFPVALEDGMPACMRRTMSWMQPATLADSVIAKTKR